MTSVEHTVLIPAPVRRDLAAPTAAALLRRAATLTGATLILTLFISYEFWLPERLYPLTPVFGFGLPGPVGRAVLVALVGSLVVLVLARMPLVLYLVPSGLLLLLIAADQSRMQPYVFMYLITLLVCSARTRSADDLALTDALRFLCAGAYFWSGLQKINHEFVHSIFPWFMGPLRSELPTVLADLLSRSGYLVPVYEALIGLLLIFSPWKWVPLLMAASMLAVVLFCLGPLGHNWNIIVWPWNVWLFTMTVWLFWRQPVPPGRLFGLQPKLSHLVKALVFVLIVLCPAASMKRYWDGYMSFKLYSGNTYRAFIRLEGDDRDGLPMELQRFAGGSLSLSTVSFTLYDVAPYPERRIFLSVWDQWCERYRLDDSRLEITFQTSLFGRRDGTETFRCPGPG